VDVKVVRWVFRLLSVSWNNSQSSVILKICLMGMKEGSLWERQRDFGQGWGYAEYIPSFWKSAIALLCCLSSFAHLAKSSWADTALSSRFKRMTSFLSAITFLWEEDVGVGSWL
jgi:hypothetical protein